MDIELPGQEGGAGLHHGLPARDVLHHQMSREQRLFRPDDPDMQIVHRSHTGHAVLGAVNRFRVNIEGAPSISPCNDSRDKRRLETVSKATRAKKPRLLISAAAFALYGARQQHDEFLTAIDGRKRVHRAAVINQKSLM